MINICILRIKVSSHIKILSGEHRLLLLHIHTASFDESIRTKLLQETRDYCLIQIFLLDRHLSILLPLIYSFWWISPYCWDLATGNSWVWPSTSHTVEQVLNALRLSARIPDTMILQQKEGSMERLACLMNSKCKNDHWSYRKTEEHWIYSRKLGPQLKLEYCLGLSFNQQKSYGCYSEIPAPSSRTPKC